MPDRNIYANQELGISIEKPEAWRFIPVQWALILLLSRVEPLQDEVDELVRSSREPLFYFHYDHGLADQVLPTVCGMHHVSPGIGSADRGVLLGMQVVQLQSVFDDFALIEATPDGLISQRPANIIRAAFTVYGKGGCRLECLSQCHLVFTGDCMFSIEMSGPARGEYQSEEEFRDILGSIRID